MKKGSFVSRSVETEKIVNTANVEVVNKVNQKKEVLSEEEFSNNLCEKLRNLIQAKGSRYEEIASKALISVDALRSYTRSKKRSTPTPYTICKLAEIFDVSTDYLLGRCDSEQIPDKVTTPEDYLVNLYKATKGAKISINAGTGTVTFSLNDIPTMRFFMHISGETSITEICDYAKHYAKYMLYKNRLLTQEQYEEAKYIDFVYGDIRIEDYEQIPEEIRNLIASREDEWKERKGIEVFNKDPGECEGEQ